MKGLFITLEGIDGSGKSTLARALTSALLAEGLDVVQTRAPGGTELGLKIRELILHNHLVDIKTELFLFLADRSEHTSQLIRPALEAGKIVLCDRFSDSTIAYQAQRGLDAAFVSSLCRYATGDLTPDLTLLIDIDPATAYARIEKNRHKDRIENEGLYLLTKIHKAYLELAQNHPRIVPIDGRVSAAELLEVSLGIIKRCLDQKSS